MSPRKASVDVEFKSYVTGYEDSKRKVQEIIDLAKEGASVDSASKDKKRFDESTAIGKLANKFDVVGKKFLKPLARVLGAAGVLATVLSVIKQITSQAQVFASIINLIFTPFILMVNLMLLPVLKWIIPKVTEWLEWVTDNKDAFDFFGKVLVSIGESIFQLVGIVTTPFKVFVETVQGIIDIINTDGISAFDKLGQIGGLIIVAIADIALIPMRLVETILDALYTIGINTPFIGDVIKFFENLFSDIWNSVKGVIRPIVEAIPIVGEDIANALFGTKYEVQPYNNPLLGDSLPTLSPSPFIGPAVGATDYELIIMNSDINPADIKTPSQPVGNMLKAKLGTT